MKFLLLNIYIYHISLYQRIFFILQNYKYIYIYIYTQKDKQPHTAYKMQRLKKTCVFLPMYPRKSSSCHNFHITPILTTVLNMNKKQIQFTAITNDK
jgi:hypothetical protein